MYKKYKNIFDEINYQLNMVDINLLLKIKNLINETNSNGGKILIAGNGGSHAIASHLSVDFTNACGIPSIAFSDPSLISCLSNDFSYEEALGKFVAAFLKPNDLVILISSSGNSQNIVYAAEFAKRASAKTVILSGFSPDNKLSQYGDVNIHIPIEHYNIVENVHQILLTTIVDDICDYRFTKEYKA